MGRTVGQNCREAREASGIGAPRNVEALLARLYPGDKERQISSGYLYKIERDEANPNLDMFRLLADVYGVPLARFFVFDDEPNWSGPKADVPEEYKPLVEVLRPLTREAREGIVRNVAAMLAMNERVWGGTKDVPNGHRQVVVGPDILIPRPVRRS